MYGRVTKYFPDRGYGFTVKKESQTTYFPKSSKSKHKSCNVDKVTDLTNNI